MKKILFILFILFMFSYSGNVYAKKHEADFDKLSEYFSTLEACHGEDYGCRQRAEYKFYLKMYDLYYLYLTKYDVELDLPLLMATLYYNNSQMNIVLEDNLSDYDREAIVESDWNPSSVTELDWDYDYESQDNYLVNNDFSMDMQVLAKNMVTKRTNERCVKDNKTTKEEEIIDDNADLECEDGEELKKDEPSYELDLDKYDDFLLEYIENKYYLNRKTDNPVYSEGPTYISDKKPSIIEKRKKKSTTSNNEKDGNYVGNVSFMTGNFGKIYYFNQGEEPYGNYPYQYCGTISGCGCGPTALSIVISSFLDEKHDPIELTDYVCSVGGCTVGGTVHQTITDTIIHYGLKVNKTGDTQAVIDALSSGKALVIAIMCPGHFTTGGHFITLTGASSDGTVIVADPASRDNSTSWPFNTVVEETCSSGGAPFWIVTK